MSPFEHTQTFSYCPKMEFRLLSSLIRFFITFLSSLLPSSNALILPNGFNQTASKSFQPPIYLTHEPDGSIRTCVTDPSWSKFHHNIAPSFEAALRALADNESIYGSAPGIFTYSNGRS